MGGGGLAPQPPGCSWGGGNWGVTAGKKKKKTRGDHFKLRFRKNFQALLEEQVGLGGLGGVSGG